jgi:DNA-binding transcriptional ArsR family regulator
VTFNLRPEAFQKAITPRTRAVVPTHVYGLPCDMDEIMALARERGLRVIEDCAHSLGATYRDQPVGTFGELVRAQQPPRKTLPTGSGSFSIIRSLIKFVDGEGDSVGATALAAHAGVSQPRASQVLRLLQDQKLVEKAADRRWRPRRTELLDRFLAEYPGPGGSMLYFYSLDSPTDVAIRAARELKDRVVVSADVGPDLIRPWRRPSEVILYAQDLVDAARLGLVQAHGRHDANVVVRMPTDRSVFPVPALVAEVQGAEVGLADPSQMIWDLRDLGGADRSDAAAELRTWLLTRR